jgi:hypothetical protein
VRKGECGIAQAVSTRDAGALQRALIDSSARLVNLSLVVALAGNSFIKVRAVEAAIFWTLDFRFKVINGTNLPPRETVVTMNDRFAAKLGIVQRN